MLPLPAAANKSWLSLIALLAFALVAVSCSQSTSVDASRADAPLLRVQLAGPNPSDLAEAELPDEVLSLVEQMTTEQKIGQLFMPVVAGSDSTDIGAEDRASNLAVFGFETPAEIINAYHLGGVMYLATNVDNAGQVASLTNELQSVAGDVSVPMLIAIDQEGGRVNRITEGVTVAPSAAELSGDAEAVRLAAEVTATEVSALGVNVVLAPVADLNDANDPGVIGDRSFGADPSQTADMVAASVGGLQNNGVAAAVKHWPGHGPTSVDSHQSKPLIELEKTDWEQRDLLPFEAALDENVEIVLVGHLAFPNFAPDTRAATVSEFLIDSLLRQELGYDKVVMSDALNMGAVADIPQSQLGVQSLNAGVDVLLYPGDMAAMYQGLVVAVGAGEVTEERLNEAVLRILWLKFRLGLLDGISTPGVVAGEPEAAEADDVEPQPAPERPASEPSDPPAEEPPAPDPPDDPPVEGPPEATTTTVPLATTTTSQSLEL